MWKLIENSASDGNPPFENLIQLVCSYGQPDISISKMDTQQQSPNPNRPSNSAPDQQAMFPAGYSQEQEVSQPRPDGDAKRKKEPNSGGGGRGGRKNKRKDLGRKAWRYFAIFCLIGFHSAISYTN